MHRLPSTVRPTHRSPLRRLPIGAEVQPDGSTHFRVWAPNSRQVAIEFVQGVDLPNPVPLHAEPRGYHSGLIANIPAGALYRVRLDHGVFPDPASRFQPDGPAGPSQVVDPTAFQWTDYGWQGPSPRQAVIYELHLGTFTPSGTWRAAIEHLAGLRQLGVTVLEVMPIADFAGAFGWGYDGVDLFAPSRLYGLADDVRAFIDRAHSLGLAVILDVVYNHFGPDGNYLAQFAPDYFRRVTKTEWGDAINFDGENSEPVREFFIANAQYWIDEFHFDGLRFDATQQIFDASPTHIVAEIVAAVREIAGTRRLLLIGENEPQNAAWVRPREQGGHGLDALWNDDFHHSAMVAATGRAEAYYSDYRGTPQEFISAAKRGFLFQGQWYHWQRQRRGTPSLDLAGSQLVIFLQNHDQVANSLRGLRLHQQTSPGLVRALTALTLLAPQTPLLFQGQEFAASSPFLYFADHKPDLREEVAAGRRSFLEQFPSIVAAQADTALAEPGDRSTFERCKLNWSERAAHSEVLRLHTDLLRLRHHDETIAAPDAVDGAVLAAEIFVVRYFSGGDDDRLILVNLGAGAIIRPAPEPLLAPPETRGWHILWSSEDPVYGGLGTPPIETTHGWRIPAASAVVMKPGERSDLPPAMLHEGH